MKTGLKGLFVVGERTTFSKMVEIVEIARKANSVTSRMLSEKKENELDASAEEIHKLEKRSDELSFSLKEDIVDGAINPNVIDNLLGCAEILDEMLDTYYFLARELKRMTKTSRSKQDRPAELDSSLRKSSELADKAFDVVTALLQEKDISKAAELRGDVEKLEEEGDEAKDNAFDSVYEAASALSFLEFNHYSLLLHKMDDALDSCEDLSDSVIEIMRSIAR